MLKSKGDLLGCKTLDPFFQWLHLPYEDTGKPEKLCLLNTPSPTVLSCSVKLPFWCSWMRTVASCFYCSGAPFLQASSRILDGATATQRSARSSVSLKGNSAGMEFMAKETTTPVHIARHNHGFRYLDCTSRLIFTLFRNKFSSAQTKRLTTVKNVLVPKA